MRVVDGERLGQRPDRRNLPEHLFARDRHREEAGGGRAGCPVGPTLDGLSSSEADHEGLPYRPRIPSRDAGGSNLGATTDAAVEGGIVAP